MKINLLLRLVLVLGITLAGIMSQHRAAQSTGDPNELGACIALIEQIRAGADPSLPAYERYRAMPVIDIHNHDAYRVTQALEQWDNFGVDQTVLFGAISERAARITDQLALNAYYRFPDRIIPFFAAVPIYDDDAAGIVTEKLELGFYGIGEIVGASEFSPLTSHLEWKARHPNDGHLPEIYALAAEYHVPVLLHIDPPSGYPIQMLEQAADENPGAILVFAHANAFNSPEAIQKLLDHHPNIWIDFYAGFTAYNPESDYTLADYMPLIETYPDRFFISTDSGSGITYPEAARAMFEFIDLLTPESACKVASINFDMIIEAQAATSTQIALFNSLTGQTFNGQLNKRQMNELMIKNLIQP